MTGDRPWQGADPAPANLYVAHFRVRFHETDPLGHVNNAVYLNYLEQAAIDHAAAAGFGADLLRERGGVFIARRHEIDYLRPALADDWLRVVTWAVDLVGARAIRAYQIVRVPPKDIAGGSLVDGLIPLTDTTTAPGDIIVRARTEWAYVDVDSGRPKRVPPDLRAAFLAGE